jgi:hypothetical protein
MTIEGVADVQRSKHCHLGDHRWRACRRRPQRLAVGTVAPALHLVGLATTAGVIVSNSVLNLTNATGFDIDGPILSLSWQDVGSGIFAFTVAALALGLVTERQEPAGSVVKAAAIAGLVAMIFDIFVL